MNFDPHKIADFIHDHWVVGLALIIGILIGHIL